MSINSLHQEYETNLHAWLRARDVLAGEDAIKAGAERYLPRVEDQTDDEYRDYRMRASFFNATARTADGYAGLVFRRPPFLTLPSPATALGRAMAAFDADADMLGTSFSGFARQMVNEVISVGRAGSLIDWDESEGRAYVSAFRAEDILNWRVQRINGRNVVTLLVLREADDAANAEDEFDTHRGEHLRVLRLVPGDTIEGEPDEPARSPDSPDTTVRPMACVMEIWRRVEDEWLLAERRVPRRLGEPLPLIPFAFHGPRHSQASVDKLPLADLIAINLDHYRLNADYKHGVHYIGFPTAWVVGFDTTQTLRLGSRAVWMAENPSARANFLEFKGDGLTTFERAMDRDERLLAVLGSRLLEPSKKVGETAEAIELRQSGENSVLGSLALSLSESLTQVLRWVYWWNSTESLPEHVSTERASIQLNTDFSIKGMSATELESVVAAWQAGALSRETMLDLFRRGEVLPEKGAPDGSEAAPKER